MRSAGYDPYFYDIDVLRPRFEEVVQFFKDQAPDVVGISSVVSTAYAYTKQLALAIKEVSPHTKVVVGGNLAASSEILLRFCKVDACGEGEIVMVNLVKYWEDHSAADDFPKLRRLKGIAYLDEDGEMMFTGYEVAIPATEFVPLDWTTLEQYSRIENFITDPLERYDFAQDTRSYEPHRHGQKMGTVLTAKGCVARCTFYHRWDRGYRHWPVDLVIDNYNVGFITFTDENFGSDRRKLDELIERIKPLDILYQVGGVRCRSVDPDLLRRLKESGCVAMYYGMETGSPRILEIMEKNTDLQMNIDAAMWTYEAGIYTIYQMVLGMPGEDHVTIGETRDFINKVTEFLPEPPHKRLSLNYIQALPGTPVYEYARNMGMIGQTLEDEEKYLAMISDIDASDDTKFLNFTEYDYFTVQSWRSRIVFDAAANWYRKRNWKPASQIPEAALLNNHLPDTDADEDYNRGGYFNLGHGFITHPLFYRVLSFPICYPLRAIYPAVHVLGKDVKTLPRKRFLSFAWEFVAGKLKKGPGLGDFRSLRGVMKDRTPTPATSSEQSMIPMREGR